MYHPRQVFDGFELEQSAASSALQPRGSTLTESKFLYDGEYPMSFLYDTWIDGVMRTNTWLSQRDTMKWYIGQARF
jgi:hypothetical protein